MLSVLRNGTLHLSEELSSARDEASRLRTENLALLQRLDRSEGATSWQLAFAWRSLAEQRNKALKQAAFLAFQSCRARCLAWRGSGAASSGRGGAWHWLWHRKLFSVWRRVAHLGCRAALTEQSRAQTCRTVEHFTEVQRRNQDLETLLACERRRILELQEALGQAQTQVSELQATLKDCYVRQFEEAQQREALENQCEALTRDVQRLRSERERLGQEVSQRRDELARSEARHAQRELRLYEASGELSLAEEVIDDITSSRCSGLRRFFERYDLPKVLTCLFCKVVELQGQLRARSPGAAPAPAALAVEAEIRQHLNLHREGAVSRHALQAYVEALHLPHASSAMVTQVVLALLGLNLGEGFCDVLRFTGLLLDPPPWEKLEFATALWGAVGESAATIVMQHRRSMSRNPSQGSGVVGVQRRPSGASGRASSPPGKPAPKSPGSGTRPLSAARSRGC